MAVSIVIKLAITGSLTLDLLHEDSFSNSYFEASND